MPALADHVTSKTSVSFPTSRLDAQKSRIRRQEHHRLRTSPVPDIIAECDRERLSWPQRAACLMVRMCQAEKPVIRPDEHIVFNRTVPSVPPIYSPEDWGRMTTGRILHELGPVSNICADWGSVLRDGLLHRRKIAIASRERFASDTVRVEFLNCAIACIDAVLDLAARYADEARRQGRDDIAAILDHVPALPPRTLQEALQSLRLLHASVWMAGHYHVGLGRVDQYLWPYLENDLAEHRLDLSGAEELLAEFFISLNKDSDLYPGVQQGDNGQTIMLGGVTPQGAPAVNELTRMALRVGLYTLMIDPKINLRITRETDVDLLMLATELTRRGLGFPQYSNDEIVIPALIAHGYATEDARNYTVAACWEFIIPGKGMEVVNTGAVSMPLAVDQAMREAFGGNEGFDRILARTSGHIADRVRDLVEKYSRLLLPPAPWYSVLMEGCLGNGRDLSAGLKYNNFGIHGAGSSSAADMLAAIRHFVYEEKSVSPARFLEALDANFQGHEALRDRLLHEAPKVGNDPEAADLLAELFDRFADGCESAAPTNRGGQIRPGSGSAMYYVWLTRGAPGARDGLPIGATADGRLEGEFFSANLAPSPQAQVRGPLSILQAFSQIDYNRICNGGPITMELSDSVFSDEEGIEKCALLVRTFAQLGGQQLQLNTVNLHTLLDAREHPEHHRNLIVRVWGWSGYFCELAPEYQEHIIARHIYGS
ncbi:MAG: pyruvate formate lyase family protein [Acidobacteriaceae bacterium]